MKSTKTDTNKKRMTTSDTKKETQTNEWNIDFEVWNVELPKWEIDFPEWEITGWEFDNGQKRTLLKKRHKQMKIDY
jgi:hypothetical protein